MRRLSELVIACVLTACLVQAQQGKPAGKTSVTANGALAQPPKTPQPNPQLTAIEARLTAIEQKVQPAGVDARLGKLEELIRGLKPSPLYVTLLPPFMVLIGVLIGQWNAERLQAKKAAQDLALSDKQAKLEIGSAVVDWEIKQLSLLYGPLRALLGQSEALYREMNNVLLGRDSKVFRTLEKDGEKPEFQIQYPAGQWTRFRTVLHIFEVYGRDFGVETYFDELVAIGAEIVKIIQQQAGYARPEQKDLMLVFGKYLAHFAVLKSMHDAAKAKVAAEKRNETTPQPAPSVNPSAAFPDTIHTLVNQGFDAITNDIQEWRRRAAA